MSDRIDRVTEYRVHGYNPFYDGYLANLFGLPRECPHATKNSVFARESWFVGWDTAAETNSLETARYLLREEQTVKRDHIRIERVERTPLPVRVPVHAKEVSP